MPEPGISVVICCFNSATRLGETLKHLALQAGVNDALWEVIVVDNASKDDTPDAAKRLWSALNRPDVSFKTLSEPTPGKSYALKKGIDNAAFDLVLVCDDDNWLHADYLAKAFHLMQADASIGVLGGCGVFHPETPSQPEIAGHERAFVNGPQTWAEQDHWVYGAGSVFRKDIISRLFDKGWQPIASGKNAMKLVEDVECSFVCYLNGYRVTSDDSLIFEHFVPGSKQRIGYVLELIFRQGYSYILLAGYRKLIEHDATPLADKLNSTLTANLKALIKLKARAGWRRLIGRGKPPFAEQAAINSCKGAVVAIIENKRKIISHYKMLSDKQLVDRSFLEHGSVANE